MKENKKNIPTNSIIIIYSFYTVYTVYIQSFFSIQYVSKEDIKCIFKGIDQDFLSLNTQAYIAAKDGPFNPKRHPYPTLCRPQQASFKELVMAYRKDIEKEVMDWNEFESLL